MAERIASLPMYDADRAAVEAWWRGLARALRAEGLADVPARLAWPDDLDTHWRDPRLLLSQTCGYPLVTTLQDAVQVVGAFRYAVPGCDGIAYRSELMARRGEGSTIEDFRGRIAAVNSTRSHSGANALRALVAPLAVDGAFFGARIVSGSHRQSLAALRSGTADIAAIDCVTLAGLRRHAPELLTGLACIGATAAAPGLPLITAVGTSATELQALRRALATACRDPALAGVREALFIAGFEVVEAPVWRVIDEIRVQAKGAAGEARTMPVQPSRLVQTARMTDAPAAAAARPLFVACLCAAWCRTCDDYRPTFDALALEFGRDARFVWVDIEDDEAALGGVDVVDFPTLLIAHHDSLDFYGPVLPHPQTARQLLQRALVGELRIATEPALAGLPARLRALG